MSVANGRYRYHYEKCQGVPVALTLVLNLTSEFFIVPKILVESQGGTWSEETSSGKETDVKLLAFTSLF